MANSLSRLATLFLATALSFAASTVGAQDQGSDDQPDRERVARAQFHRGETLYSEGEFEEAADAFQQAYDASGRRELLFNIYLAHRDAQQRVRAADALEQYLHAMEGQTLDNRAQLERRLSALRAARAAEVERIEDDLGLGLRRSSPSFAPWIVVGVGAVAVVSGGITGLLALSKESDLLERCPERDCPELQNEADSGRRLARTTDVLLIGGAIVAGAGIIWAVLDRRRVRTDNHVSTHWSCTPDACLGSVEGRF